MKLLDLFCGAGGAAMGYHQAGYDVVGVDIKPQPNYPFPFIHADALELELELDGYDAIHASPPCQHYANVTRWRGDRADHPDLVAATRARLEATGLPYVLENVMTAPLRPDAVLCGTMFGLPIRRHRIFELSWGATLMTPPCQHSPRDLPFMHKGERAYADALGCTWMSKFEGREAIPPAYTHFIGTHMLAHG